MYIPKSHIFHSCMTGWPQSNNVEAAWDHHSDNGHTRPNNCIVHPMSSSFGLKLWDASVFFDLHKYQACGSGNKYPANWCCLEGVFIIELEGRSDILGYIVVAGHWNAKAIGEPMKRRRHMSGRVVCIPMVVDG